jgi:hypothetical protein
VGAIARPQTYLDLGNEVVGVVVESPKYGTFTLLVDESMRAVCSKYRWCVNKQGPNRFIPVAQIPHSKPRKTIKLYHLVTGFSWAMVDHINGDPLDNRLCNLRETDFSLNQANRRNHKLRRAMLEGVMVTKNRFGARMIYKNKPLYIGTFKTELEAHKAYVAKHIELFGEHSKWSNV